jgi:lactate dehydrogenase-like 2-hydroxyacid dehydrogenase
MTGATSQGRQPGQYPGLLAAAATAWPWNGGEMAARMSGATLGIVGMGRIGHAVARRACGFDMTVLYSNRTRLAPEYESDAEYVPALCGMLPCCVIRLLHLSGGPGPALRTCELFAALPRGAVFVNTACGSVVNEDVLVEALQSGHLFAAGLDVFRREPDLDLRFAQLLNVFLTPYVATCNAMGDRALDNIAAVLAGRPPWDPA